MLFKTTKLLPAGLTAYLFITGLLTGCQLQPTLLDTPEQGIHHSRFYIHPNYKKASDAYQHKHFYVDGVEMVDKKNLDTVGIPMSAGEHEIVIKDDTNAKNTQRFKYSVDSGAEQHLIYCPENGHAIWYNYKPQEDLQKLRNRVCGK